MARDEPAIGIADLMQRLETLEGDGGRTSPAGC